MPGSETDVGNVVEQPFMSARVEQHIEGLQIRIG
jgi:hypothetical protein